MMVIPVWAAAAFVYSLAAVFVEDKGLLLAELGNSYVIRSLKSYDR